MRRQATLLQDCAQMLVRKTASPLYLMTAFSLSGIEPMRFWTVVKNYFQDFRRRRSSVISVCGFGLV